MISPTALSGYLLEEVLAHLLKASGYHLLTEPDDDPLVLVKHGNGLRVRGRGASHQADALGELRMAIPFSLPIRLFVEAKNIKEKVGLDVVRNAHGVVHDVNEYQSSQALTQDATSYLKRVQYRYSIFSTGGFTRDAQMYAITHQISPIDLSGPDWSFVANRLRAGALDAVKMGLVSSASPGSIATARIALREALSALEPSDSIGRVEPQAGTPAVRAWSRRLATTILRSEAADGLLLGFTSAPFILALRPNDYDQFRRAAFAANGPLSVAIAYERGPLGGSWFIEPHLPEHPFRLTFTLPGALEQILIALPEERLRRAASAIKDEFLGQIALYVDGRPITLEFERRNSRPRVGHTIAETAQDLTPLRQDGQRNPVHASTATLDNLASVHDRGAPKPSAGWTVDSVRELLRRLDAKSYVQAALIRHAATHGGAISREAIYQLAGFAPDRSLRALARPTMRITADLIAEGRLPHDAPYPFEPAYATGGVAAEYLVPQDVVEAFSRAPLL